MVSDYAGEWSDRANETVKLDPKAATIAVLLRPAQQDVNSAIAQAMTGKTHSGELF